MPGVTNPARARVDYILKCQGCHQANGDSHPRNTPPLTGEVSQFLSVKGGREFLGRVPGVATTDLDDERLTDLLNWTLYRFDRANIPADFKPYTTREVASLRQHPLRLERLGMREALIAEIAKNR